MGPTLLGVQGDAKSHLARDVYLIPAMQDPAPFHAIMAYIGYLRDLMSGRPPGPDSISHKVEAIKLINERLSKGEFDDSTINAITTLWVHEACKPSHLDIGF